MNKTTVSRFTFVFIVTEIISYLIAIGFQFAALATSIPRWLVFNFLLLLSSLIGILLCTTVRTFRVFYLIQSQGTFLFLFAIGFPAQITTVLLLYMIITLDMYERKVMAAAFQLLCLGEFIIFFIGYHANSTTPIWEMRETLIYIILIIIGSSILAKLMMHYRENLIAEKKETTRLSSALGSMTSANKKYQDHLLEIEAHAIEQERQRITRDIHDIAGYTLTNNIMLMEVAMDLMRNDPLGLPRTLKTARENAQDGLDRIRSTLYDFRSEKTNNLTGLEGLIRTVKVFEMATGVQVQMELANAPWSFTEEVDSALVHLVEEALMNSFRHGKATEIRIHLLTRNNNLELFIRDNGAGMMDIKKGIGLNGMSERVLRLDGNLLYSNVEDGFEIRAKIPL